MTLDEITSFVTSKVGQTDTYSVNLCKDFVKRRYGMVWDAHLWRDTQMHTTTTATTGSDTVAMPNGMERVISVRAGGRALDPIDATYLLQTDPAILERNGTPIYYEEYTDTAGTAGKKIRLYPTPAASTSLFIVGKRVKPELTSGSGNYSTAIIRNIDNALIAYATGDMLERQRQYAKAQAKFTEANAMLEAAKAVESSQANQPRRAKGLTASGNSLAEMSDAVSARAGTWALEDVIVIKDLLRRNYQTVYDSALWQESTAVALVASDGEQLILPEYFDRVMAVRANADLPQLVPTDLSYIFGIAPSVFEETKGNQLSYTILTPVAVSVVPPGLERMTVQSSDSSDTATVFIRGESQGRVVTENVILNGTTPVTTANFYDYPLTISKPLTTGNVTVKGLTSTVELQVIPAAELERKHIRLWLHPANETSTDCLVFGKRKITPLISDDDTPMLRDVQNVLIEMTVADMLARANKLPQAQAATSKAERSIVRLMDLERKQGANQPRVVPTVEQSSYHAGGFWEGWFLPK